SNVSFAAWASAALRACFVTIGFRPSAVSARRSAAFALAAAPLTFRPFHGLYPFGSITLQGYTGMHGRKL
ncbi:hypothetical protein, partial [Pseudomonas syringae]|uniref:hypothetical protein n=1 Tax=Pseudomonas syringae TaxID=317 RepID=UPI001C80DB70